MFVAMEFLTCNVTMTTQINNVKTREDHGGEAQRK